MGCLRNARPGRILVGVAHVAADEAGGAGIQVGRRAIDEGYPVDPAPTGRSWPSIILEPITRAEITARRLADSDRQVQLPLCNRLIREEPRATVPGRGIPLVTTDLVLRCFGVQWIGEFQHRLLAAATESEVCSSAQPPWRDAATLKVHSRRAAWSECRLVGKLVRVTYAHGAMTTGGTG
jgi:hypothetical protein